MSFEITTEKNVWTISMGVCTCCNGSVWVGFNKEYKNIEADTLDHLMIKIDQFENPEEFQ